MFRTPLPILLLLAAAPAWPADAAPTEDGFRKMLGIGPAVRLEFRDVDCKPVSFSAFSVAMTAPDMHADVDRAADGSAVMMTVKHKGNPACPSPFPPVTAMPPFDLRDLAGKRVTSKSLQGKPTLISFYFARCVPCIREVGPLNRYAASRPDLNFLAMTFDEPAEVQAFVQRFGLRWRVVPDAREFIDRMRVKQYPLLALFDAQGRLLGTQKGGAKDDLEAAAVEPQVRRWVEGLLPR